MIRASTGLALVFVLTAWACAGGQPAPQPQPSQDTQASGPKPEEPAPAADRCGDAVCAPPEQCIRYYGVAGPSIPLYACGLPCGEQGECPDGKRCEAIADGPRMCR